MTKYTYLQIIKHALQHYIKRENAPESDIAKETKILENIIEEIDFIKRKYNITPIQKDDVKNI